MKKNDHFREGKGKGIPSPTKKIQFLKHIIQKCSKKLIGANKFLSTCMYKGQTHASQNWPQFPMVKPSKSIHKLPVVKGLVANNPMNNTLV